MKFKFSEILQETSVIKFEQFLTDFNPNHPPTFLLRLDFFEIEYQRVFEERKNLDILKLFYGEIADYVLQSGLSTPTPDALSDKLEDQFT